MCLCIRNRGRCSGFRGVVSTTFGTPRCLDGESTLVYHTLSEVPAQYIRNKGTPRELQLCPAKMRLVSAKHALKFAADVAYFCGYYLSPSIC